MNSPTHLHKSFGFTLIELLIVVGIIAAISGMLIPGFSTYIQNQNLKQAAEQLKNDLRTVQNKAMTGVNATSTSLYWVLMVKSANASDYYYYVSTSSARTCDTGTTPSLKSSKLPGDVVIRNSPICVFFTYADGDAYITNSVGNTTSYPQIYLGKADTPNGKCNSVIVNKGGLVVTALNTPCQ